ncbi:MAG: MBL fold metallo-hydrolase [Dehalococcoidales bacterium]|nr:MBL fold metallo-hydrolase [Dehalococcoidales bacterium]
MKQISANVYADDQHSVPPRYRGSNPSYVTTSDGIVLIDTPMMPTDAVRWQKDLAKKGTVRYIINTHHHLDHISGNVFFPGATVIAHAGAMEKYGSEARPGIPAISLLRKSVEQHDPEGVALLKEDQFPPPSITFTDRLYLYVGKHTFELIHMPGHTPSHIGVYIPQEKVFFAGDNFTYQTQPSFGHSVPQAWVKSLKQVEEMDIDTIVPGHGEICGKAEVKEFRKFVETCIKMVKDAMKRGLTKEQAAKELSFEKLYPKNPDASAVHPGPDQQRFNVERLYDMLAP